MGVGRFGISPGCISPFFLKAYGVLKNVPFRQIIKINKINK